MYFDSCINLLFVDDIFFEAILGHLHNLWCLFFCFEVVSGLKINLTKSKLVLVGGLASILGCRDSLPMRYLGLLLGALFKAKCILDGIIEKMETTIGKLEAALLVKRW